MTSLLEIAKEVAATANNLVTHMKNTRASIQELHDQDGELVKIMIRMNRENLEKFAALEGEISKLKSENDDLNSDIRQLKLERWIKHGY